LRRRVVRILRVPLGSLLRTIMKRADAAADVYLNTQKEG